MSVNQVQGGSQDVLQKTGDGMISLEVKQFLDEEAKSILYQADILSEWPSRIKLNMVKFGKIVKDYVAAGKTVVGYGAPTKATLLMKMSDLASSDICFIVEDNVLKINKFMPGTAVPLLNIDELKQNPTSLLFLLGIFIKIIQAIKSSVNWQRF